ncbi:hypothetical protein HBO36_02925 [Pseudomonas chlororaphis]|nr:hypothetical protein [Pseudomonas chlororaphis]
MHIATGCGAIAKARLFTCGQLLKVNNRCRHHEHDQIDIGYPSKDTRV